MKDIIKKFWVIPASIVLLYILLPIGMMMVYMLLSVTDNLLVSYAIPCVATGAVSALPIIFKVAKAKQMKKGTKCFIIVLAIVLLSAGAFLLMQA